MMECMHRLRLLACATLIAIPIVAYADQVDCSSTQHWSSDHRYKKGDQVWHHEGGNLWEKYSCNKDECVGAGQNEPGKSGGPWKFVGTCKEKPTS
jgi:hypothetical protein